MTARDTLSRENNIVLQRELGHALSELGRFDEAEVLILSAISGQEETVGAASVVNLRLYGVAAEHYRRKDELVESLAYGEKIATIIRDDSRPLAWEGALALLQYGHTLQALGRDTEASAVLSQARAVLSETFGENDLRVTEIPSP